MFTTSPDAMPSPSVGLCSERDERLAGRDRDPHLEVALLPDPVSDRERGAYGTLGIVFVGGRRPEERHHRIADELLHGATPLLELFPEP